MILSVTSVLCLNAQTKSLHQLQQEFVDLRCGMFIHFNMPTFFNEDWPDPDAAPELFNPVRMDCKQWAKAAKSANMTYGCLTTKHHSGFCIWDTKTTDYSVMSSPFKRDVVKEYADAFRAEGMKVVSDYIHSLGLRAGIYSDAGDNTCGSIYDNDANGVGSGLYGHEQQDMDLYIKEWNYDFIKIDYCGGRELGLDEEKRYNAICQAIANTGRTDVSINICRWAFPGTWAKKLARSWRISPDIRPKWNSVKGIIEKNLYLSAYATGGHYNDMDMLEIGRGLKPNEEEVHFGMWCIMSSPLLIGCDMNTIPDFSLKLLKNKELIALNQDVLGLQAHVVQHENESYVLVKDIEQKRGLTRAVALYNPSNQPCDFIVPFETLELGGEVKVRDLIKQEDLGKMKGEIRQTVQPHSVLICKVKAEKRLEPVCYEAEWAYLPCYDDLGKKSKPIVYVPDADCSGKMKISRLGGREENFAEWSEVYSEKGGKYNMTIFYSCDKNRKLEVSVNGTETVLKDLNSNKEVKSITIPVTLQKGYNTVRMGNDFGWAPDIDRFTLSRQ